MQKLEESYNSHGREFKLVKRDVNKAMFRSDSDGIVEVFKIKVLPPTEIYGRSYPEREGFPNDEDFGKIAFCYTSNYELAEDKYQSL